jgi:hypothetical protein
MPPTDEELTKRRYRYIGQGQTGLRNDSRSAEIAAGMAAGIPPSYAYQTSSPTAVTTSSTPLASGANTGLITQTVDYSAGEHKTTYAGLPAFRIDVSIVNLVLGPGQAMANPVDVTENGVLLGWTVAVNDPAMKITSIIYGDNNTSTTLWDDTIEAITYLGRGLTQGQADAVAPGQINYSLDMQGVKDDMWPWIQRYRSTPSKNAIVNNIQYDTYAGTADDIWLVAAYTPVSKEGYSRIYLNVTNTSANPRMILRLQMSRIKFQPSVAPVYTSATGDYAHVNEPYASIINDRLI